MEQGSGGILSTVAEGHGGPALAYTRQQERTSSAPPASSRGPASSRFGAAARQRWMRWLRPIFALVGILALVLLVRDAGITVLRDILTAAAPWLPLVVGLEFARVGTDALATYWTLGDRARHLPTAVLMRAQLVATAVSGIAPAGRAAGEAVKAAMIAPWAGSPAATASAATAQAVTLLAAGIISIPCAVASWQIAGPRATITMALIVHSVVLIVIGTLMRYGMRARRVCALLARMSRRSGDATAAFQATVRSNHLLPGWPIAAQLVGRVLQIVQYAILAYAVGVPLTLPRALVAQGMNMVGLAVGVLVPGQVGVSEGAFALGADALGTSLAKAISIALLAHVIQVAFIPLGAFLPIIWKVRPPTGEPAEQAS